jgi:hypothetical protein
MPVDYRRALAEMAKHQDADTSGLEVIEIGMPRAGSRQKPAAE